MKIFALTLVFVSALCINGQVPDLQECSALGGSLWPVTMHNVGGRILMDCQPILTTCRSFSPALSNCFPDWRSFCPTFNYVGGLRRTFTGRLVTVQDNWNSYEVKCCSHPYLTSGAFTGTTPTDLPEGHTFDASGTNSNGQTGLYVANIVNTGNGRYQLVIGAVECPDIRLPQQQPIQTQFQPPQVFQAADPGLGAGAAACYPEDALIQTRTGHTMMKDLAVGDHVYSISPDGVGQYEPVLFFIHREPEYMSPDVLEITVERGDKIRKLSMTKQHLLPPVNCNNDNVNGQLTSLVKPASEISVNECVLVKEDEQTTELMKYKVTAIKPRTDAVGIYAPFTYSGFIVVNDVVTSVHSNTGAYTINLVHGLFQYTYNVWASVSSAYSVFFAPPTHFYPMCEWVMTFTDMLSLNSVILKF